MFQVTSESVDTYKLEGLQHFHGTGMSPLGDHTNSMRPHPIHISVSPNPGTLIRKPGRVSLVHTEKTPQMSVVGRKTPKL